ncbi:hypothetical protein GVX82_01590 [Patescibacteria group bacterium]|jgi:hypothetical protein|nr:hypothetical protein [Patescibacteria group bacterium]
MDEDQMTGATPMGDEPANAPTDDAAPADPLASPMDAPEAPGSDLGDAAAADPMAEGQMPAAEDLPISSEGGDDGGDTFAL